MPRSSGASWTSFRRSIADIANASEQDAYLEGRIKSMEQAYRMQFEATGCFRHPQGAGENSRGIREHTVRQRLSAGAAARGARRSVHPRQLRRGAGLGRPQGHQRALKKRCPDMDQAAAALIRDLDRRGMLDETIVVWGGEFGRTPVSESGDGRDHNPYGFTMWVAGGGFKGGMAYGATDDFGFKAVENRVSIHDLHATILYALGIDHTRLTYRYAGRDFRLTDVFGEITKDILT